jgi:hypothetical protein
MDFHRVFEEFKRHIERELLEHPRLLDREMALKYKKAKESKYE